MTTLLIAEHDNQALADATRRAVTAAGAIGAPVHILVAGANCAAVAEQACELAGVAQVLLLDDASMEHPLAEPLADVIVAIVRARGHEAVIAAATSFGKNLLPRVAGLLDVMIIADAIAIEAGGIFVRPIYAGNALERLRTRDAITVITARASSFAPAVSGATPAPIERMDLPGSSGGARSRLIDRNLAVSERPELASARIVVSGGRALASSENFTQVLTPLADALGAALGATRAAVDAGYAPNDWQVGQTGKIVAPELYIAAGVSGAIQHLAGMKDSKYIVAINTDADAPIFAIADYALVADVFTAVPELAAALRSKSE